jgi:hypothetical protein
MTSVPKTLSVFYFFSGLVVGLLIGLSVNKELVPILLRVLATCTIIVVAFFWRRIESYAHKRYLETWSNHKSGGKWRFIITQYVLIRGSALTAAVILPAIPTLILTTYTVVIILATTAILVLLLIYLGHESWTECQQDNQVQVFRHAAEQSKVSSN